jgi:hypothetical protein
VFRGAPRAGLLLPMPIVHECTAPDCHVLTMGVYCLEHENVEERESLIAALAPTEQPSVEMHV